MIQIDYTLEATDFSAKLNRLWALSAQKIRLIDQQYDATKGSPVFTAQGQYATRGWTEWTQGFQYGSAILQYDATDDPHFLAMGRQKTIDVMASHVSHVGVHDHGFNNVSTYGNLLRLMRDGRIPFNESEKNFYELALKVSGAVQAGRWTSIHNRSGQEAGFIHSFNGAHSLFVDTIRSCRALVLSHSLEHVYQGEGDVKIDLLARAVQHMRATANYSVYYGEGRDTYDVWGRTAHESVFNVKDGNYRCPNSQQGYSGFTTWTRGLAWAMCGFAEQLEYLNTLTDDELEPLGSRADIEAFMLKAARATCDFYVDHTPIDGIPYWDTGAPNLYKLDDYLNRSADPFNTEEPVDSSAAAIGAQGLLRLGRYLTDRGDAEAGKRYWQAGLTVFDTLLNEPYLSTDPQHQGLLLHSIYHRPNGWDYVPPGSRIPYGESSMWGDYHLRELALYVQRSTGTDRWNPARLAAGEPDVKKPYYTFFNCLPHRHERQV